MPRAELYVGELVMKLVGRETGEISKVDYRPQKKAFSGIPFPDEEFLQRATPESQGVSSAFFTKLLRSLSEDRNCRVHKFMALRHGKVICECAFDPFDMDMWHTTYSMCKSITGMAIGLLIDEGKLTLDDRLSDIFGARIGLLNSFKKPITVRNLLNMSSGIDFNEAGALSGNDWRKGFFEASFKFDPGTKFEYNSMNSYMLSAIVTEITGQSLFDFCKERIFNPLGIKRVLWESCPQSITKGGWGLFMRIEDMAKIGQLYLQNGKWGDKQIIPRQWIVESTALQIETGDDSNRHYGYQIWVNNDRYCSYSFNGMMGQNVFVYPDVDMVVVTNAGNSDVFQTSTMAVRIREMMKNELVVSEETLPEDESSFSKLQALCTHISGKNADHPLITGGGWLTKDIKMTTGYARKKSVSTRTSKRNPLQQASVFNSRNENHLISTFLKRLDGFKYELETSGVGLMPLMMQIVHNNFTDGIRKIGFRYTADKNFFIDIYEGEVIFKLKCGFGGKSYVSDINMHSENYKVAVKSACIRDEYNRLVIRNEIYYLEETCTRSFNIYFEDDISGFRGITSERPEVPDRIEIRMTETPGTYMLIETIKRLSPLEGAGFESAIISKFLKGGMKEALEHAAKNTLEPVVYGKLINPEFKEPVEE
jgi:hypothetical protein